MAVPQYILALDYGEKRVGVAIAHVVARLPRPLTVLTNGETLLNDIRKMVDQEDVALVVVGLPRTMDGGVSAQTQAAEQFANKLKEVLTVPVDLADETLTSVDAEAALGSNIHTKGDIDAMAASLILDRYFADRPTAGANT